MSDRRVYDTKDADEGRTGPSSFLLGAGLLLAVGAAGAWWMLRASEPPRESPRTVNAPAGGPNYVAAVHVDPKSPTLSRAADGKSVLSLVLRDVKQGETVFARATDAGAKAPAGLRVFLATSLPEGAQGTLDVTSAAGKTPDERSLTIRLPRAVDRVTVIDLRWEGGRWEGFEVSATPASGPK